MAHLYRSGTKTKWPPVRRRYFEMYFCALRLSDIFSIFRSLFSGFNLTISNHCFTQWLGAEQATTIALNYDDPIQWSIYASQCLNVSCKRFTSLSRRIDITRKICYKLFLSGVPRHSKSPEIPFVHDITFSCEIVFFSTITQNVKTGEVVFWNPKLNNLTKN